MRMKHTAILDYARNRVFCNHVLHIRNANDGRTTWRTSANFIVYINQGSSVERGQEVGLMIDVFQRSPTAFAHVKCLLTIDSEQWVLVELYWAESTGGLRRMRIFPPQCNDCWQRRRWLFIAWRKGTTGVCIKVSRLCLWFDGIGHEILFWFTGDGYAYYLR